MTCRIQREVGMRSALLRIGGGKPYRALPDATQRENGAIVTRLHPTGTVQ